MSKSLSLVLDPYDRGARLYPALIATFPVFVALTILLPHFLGRDLMTAMLSLVTGCGMLVLVTHLARDAGRAKELGWYQMQGGKPSVAMLRHRDGRLTREDKVRYHRFLTGRASDAPLPSPEVEAMNPIEADATYAAAATWLLAQTRDKARFELLFRRNIDYGFRRNLTALRGVALCLDGMIALGVLGMIAGAHLGALSAKAMPATSSMVMILIISLAHAALVWRVLRPAWVAAAAEDYARQLFAACDVLGPTGGTATSTSQRAVVKKRVDKGRVGQA